MHPYGAPTLGAVNFDCGCNLKRGTAAVKPVYPAVVPVWPAKTTTSIPPY